MARDLTIAASDHFGFMAVQFHAKQIGHAHAVLQLGDHPDSALITRSMLEGLCLLKWAQQEPVARGLQWRMFSLVIDWRFAHEELKKGVDGMEAKLREIEERINEQSDALYSAKALEARRRGVPLPADPFVTTWYRPQLRQVFEAVGAGELYDGPYYLMSEWHHWSPGGLATAMWFAGDRMGYAPGSPMIHAGSLANAFQCLIETAQLVDSHFALGHEPEFLRLISDYVAEATAAGFGSAT